jgi:hypothetical protein
MNTIRKREDLLKAKKQIVPARKAEKFEYIYTFITRHENANSLKYFENMSRLKYFRASATIQN